MSDPVDLLTQHASPLSLSLRARVVVSLAAALSVVPYLLLARATPPEHLDLFVLGCGTGFTGATLATVLRGARRVRAGLAMLSIVGFTLTQAHVGGIASANAVLLVLPVLWFAILGTRRELAVAVALVATCCVAPMLVLGAPVYPVDVARAAVMVMVVLCVAVSLAILSLQTEQLTRRLRAEAREDVMTGLLNRRGWAEAARREELRAERSGVPFVVAAIDLDGLKEVNDARGHRAGDDQITTLARGLRATFRADDVVARLGGDEFAVLMVGAGAEEALATSDRLRSLLLPGVRFSTGVAHGVPGESVADVLARADEALYQAKQAGGSRTIRAVA